MPKKRKEKEVIEMEEPIIEEELIHFYPELHLHRGFPCSSVSKESACSIGD